MRPFTENPLQVDGELLTVDALEAVQHQARLILERSKPKGRIWYFADGDPAGVKCAKDTLAMLATSRLVRLVIADGRQPTDFTEGELKKLLPF